MIARLAVFGDPHGEHVRLARALEWTHGQALDAVVCTGDIADGPGCINRCCELLDDAGVVSVAGNHDRWLLDDRVRHVADAHREAELSDASRAYLTGLPRQRTLETLTGALLLCHGVGDNDLAKVWPGSPKSETRRSAELDAILAAGQHRFLINGHMHFRVLIDFAGLLMINAGTLKGQFGGMSVIDFESDCISTYELGDGGAPRRVCEHSLSPNGRRVWRDTSEFDGTSRPVTLYA